jgi:hypothetical protein
MNSLLQFGLGPSGCDVEYQKTRAYALREHLVRSVHLEAAMLVGDVSV